MRTPFIRISNPRKYRSLIYSFSLEIEPETLDPTRFEKELNTEVFDPILDDEGRILNNKITIREQILRYINHESILFENEFLDIISSNGQFTSENITHLANNQIIELEKIDLDLCRSYILDNDIFYALKDSVSELLQLLLDYKDNPYPKLKSRLNFNLNRETLIYFFTVLRERNVIDKDTSNAELAKFLDSTINYSTNNKYKQVRNSASRISDFSLEYGARDRIKPTEVLEQIFSHDEFFLL